MRLLPLIVFSAQLAGTTACTGHTPSPADVEQGTPFRSTTFVYGKLAFDTSLRLEQMGPIPYEQRDCSTPEVHCVVGNIFTAATPVDCADFAKGRFGIPAAETLVLRRETGTLASDKLPPGSYATPIWLLGSPQRPHVVLVYVADGVVGIYRDQSRDVVALARDYGLSAMQDLLGGSDAAYMPLISFQPWGSCRGRIEPGTSEYEGPGSPTG